MKRLGVWHHDVLVAELEAKRPWDLRCRYSAAAIEAGDANRPLLSCSLPVTRQKAPATPWVRLSIAGLQDKLLVCALDDGQWGRPVNGRPSSHIMKLDDGRYDDLHVAEHACLRLASDAGLRVAHSNLINVDGLDVLVVERYDRRRTDDGILERIHQEDSCQALGVDIDEQHGRGKYERFGGPTFARIAELCDRYGDPTTAFPDLLANAVFTWVIGNGDAHGKNVSLLIDIQTGHVDLAPLYDTVPTALWPTLRPIDNLAVRLVAATADCRNDRVASLVTERLRTLEH